MKSLLLILLLIFPSKHADRISIEFNTDQTAIFKEYKNDNFIQRVRIEEDSVKLFIENFGYLNVDLNFRIFLDESFLQKLNTEEKNVIVSLFRNTIKLKAYLRNISYFIKDNISYKENTLYKRAEEVLKYREANCIGFSSLVRDMLKAINIKSSYVKGFYLRKMKNNRYTPIPHRWLEISLPSGEKFFYDPQYQGFSANYIVMDGNIRFYEIKKFSVRLLERNKKFTN